MRPIQTSPASEQLENLFEDFHPLIEQLGSADGLALAGSVNASVQLQHVRNFGDLHRFLLKYHGELLAPVELPLICVAHSLASRNQYSELIKFDQTLAADPRLKTFAAASQRVGRVQLKRLRPLRDQRGLQRYIRAADEGAVHAWHTLIYGVTLASYSLPLRQGLLVYSEQVIAGFVSAASRNFEFSENNGKNVVEQICAAVPKSIEQALVSTGVGSSALIQLA